MLDLLEVMLEELCVFSMEDLRLGRLVVVFGISDLLRASFTPAAEKVGTYSLRLLCRWMDSMWIAEGAVSRPSPLWTCIPAPSTSEPTDGRLELEVSDLRILDLSRDSLFITY